MWLEFNALVSSNPLSTIFDKTSHLKCWVFVIPSNTGVSEKLRKIPYRLHKYALNHIVAHYVKEADEKLYIYLFSSNEDPISYLVEELIKHKIKSETGNLNELEVQRFVQGHKHILADSYLRLALRSYFCREVIP